MNIYIYMCVYIHTSAGGYKDKYVNMRQLLQGNMKKKNFVVIALIGGKAEIIQSTSMIFV
jgi:hypothetical protein